MASCGGIPGIGLSDVNTIPPIPWAHSESSSAVVTFSAGAMLPAAFMPRITRMTSAIPCLVSVKMTKRPLAISGHWTGVAMMRIVTVVYVTIKASRAVKPRARPNKNAAAEPVRSIVSIRGTTIRGIVKVSVRAHGSSIDSSRYLARTRPSDTGRREGSRANQQSGAPQPFHENSFECWESRLANFSQRIAS
jgi:hypothetical protein